MQVEKDYQWVAADALYDDSPAIRGGVVELGKYTFAEIKSTTQVWRVRPEVYVPEWKGHGHHPTRLRLSHPADRAVTVDGLVTAIPRDRWTRDSINGGSQR